GDFLIARSKEYFTSAATSSRPRTGGRVSHRTPGRRAMVYTRPSRDTSARRARSGTRVKSEGPERAPLTNLKSVRRTSDERNWVWEDRVPCASKLDGSTPMTLRTPPRRGRGSAKVARGEHAVAAAAAATFRKSRRLYGGGSRSRFIRARARDGSA